MAQKAKQTKNKKDSNKKRLAIALGISIPVVVAGATTGIVFGVKSCKSKTVDREVEVDDTSKTAGIKISSTTTASGDVEITLTSDETCGKKVEDITEITIGNTKLNKDDYTFDKATGKVTIKKEVLDKNPGKIVVTPTLGDKTITGISLSVTSQTVKTGCSFKIKATGKYATNEQVTWTCDSDYLVVNPDTSALGDEVTVTAKNETVDSTTVKATYGTHEATCTVKIVEKTVTGITIDQKYKSIEVGEEKDIAATITENTNLITWTQSSTDGGKVSFDGETEGSSESGKIVKLKGVTKGNVTITAKAGEKSDSFTLAVTEPAVVITKFDLGTDIKSAFTTSKINSTSITPTSPTVSFTVSTKELIANVEGHFVIYKTKGTILGTTDKEILTKGTETINRQIDVTNWTGLTSDDTLIVDWVDDSQVTAVTIDGEHNVDIDVESTLTFTATDQEGHDITNKCIWTTSDTTKQVAWFEEGSNILTLGTATTTGASLTVTATYSPSNGNVVTTDFSIEIASFSQLDTTGGDTSLQGGVAYCTGESSGNIVIPSRYYDKYQTPGDEWVPTTIIPYGGMYVDTITGVYIGKNITEIQTEAFGSGINKLVVDSSNSIYQSIEDTNCITKKTAMDVILFGCAGTNLAKAAATGINQIGDSSFLGSGITSLSIPVGIVSIGASAFSGCESLGTVEFIDTLSTPATIKNIGASAFSGCSALTSISIPASVLTIGANCFEDCDRLGSATFSDTNMWIQTGDGEKKQLNISDEERNAECLRDTDETPSTVGTNWGYTGITVNSEAVKSATVSYNEDSFTGNGITLTSKTDSILKGTRDKITLINQAGQNGVIRGELVVTNSEYQEILTQEVSFGTTATTIDITIDWDDISAQDQLHIKFLPIYSLIGSAVQLRTDYKTLTGELFVPEKVDGTTVTGVYEAGFPGASLSSIKFETPANITTISNQAFQNCENLTTCPIDDTFTGLKTIGNSAFYTPKFDSITIPKSVTTIGDYAFDSPSTLSPLATVTFESGSALTTIGEQAFEKSSISTITIPASVSTISKKAFIGCTNLTTVEFANKDTQIWYIDNTEKTEISVTNPTTNATNLTTTGTTGWADYGIKLKWSEVGLAYYEDEYVSGLYCVDGTFGKAITAQHEQTYVFSATVTTKDLNVHKIAYFTEFAATYSITHLFDKTDVTCTKNGEPFAFEWVESTEELGEYYLHFTNSDTEADGDVIAVTIKTKADFGEEYKTGYFAPIFRENL